MDQKKNLRESIFTHEELRSLLSKSDRLTGEEEKAIRMRHGYSLDSQDKLQWSGEENPTLAEELRFLEASVIRKAQLAVEQDVSPLDSREKDAIVLALKSGRTKR